MKGLAFLAGTSLIVLAACGSQEDEADSSAPATAPASQASAMPAADATQAFVDKMAGSDMFEIEAAKIAQSMGTSQDLKDFAAMMIKDYTASSEKLKAAAAQSDPAPAVAPKLNPDQNAKLAALRSAGTDFDKLYSEQQVAAHEEALAALKSKAAADSASPLGAFAAATAPTVGHHLELARKLP